MLLFPVFPLFSKAVHNLPCNTFTSLYIMKCKVLLAYTYKCIYAEICNYTIIYERINDNGQRILEMVIQCLTESRINRIMSFDEKYQASNLREKVAYDKETLTEQQKELFDNFTIAAGETGANAEHIIYQQGMRDLYALLMLDSAEG